MEYRAVGHLQHLVLNILHLHHHEDVGVSGAREVDVVLVLAQWQFYLILRFRCF
jgi:hypothetical protein